MMSFRVLRSFAIVLSATLAFGCADSPTAPAPSAPIAVDVDPQDLSLGGLLGLVKGLTQVVVGIIFQSPQDITGVKWADSHDNTTRSVSGTIGRNGGTLSIPSSDFTITFAPGALNANTPITIISDARDGYVTYDMLPHGIEFAKPVIVTQRLRNTEAYGMPRGTPLYGAYLGQTGTGGLLDIVTGTLRALESVTSITILRPDGKPELQTWSLNHFSRYILASG